ncbi:RagB/SusD family nutrient uptake outer membrane protein [Tamlana sp. 2_MG-2023]|uniref:RagB/SusD family nutrient uptake outer membrane protein n=1 Tax=unclassified Tamlana TaxID=2614803 RepID=UPI0026E29AA1|nr:MULTISPECIES: RagB/SusD family nutrient uptake outer membrane protein [unclassified Tamlana]MDO6760982.1 RagB/SusD family nutrient uptake outer membrane protein [Tamlana sp. 2_MG-2023]MDO6791238.1 RagB/SusD family nutrient uptake outer membrane protein [Tamlana sp. 1_MG-2023]
MKKYTIVTAGLFVMLSALMSCESYLEETNPNEISTDIYWSNLLESEENLTSVYGGMLNQFISGARVDSWMSDEGFPGIRIDANTGEHRANDGALNWYNHQINEDTDEVNRRWDALYQVIWRANQVIQGLEGMTEDLKSDPKWTEQMGQARFFRGLAHFYLHSIYNNGKIVIRDIVPTTPEELGKPVSESDEVITFFRSDLEYAYTNLPGQMEPKTRVDAGAAGTILGMSYLYQNDFANAQTYFDDIINNKNKDYGYSLEQDVSMMFTKAGDFNSESILEINYSLHKPTDVAFDEEDFITRNARYSAPRDGGGSSVLETFTPSTWLIHAYSNDELDPNDPRNTIVDRTGTQRLRKVSLRASAMVAVVNDEDTEYYQEPSAPILQNFTSNGLPGYFKKYTNHDITDTEQNIGINSWQSGKNVILNRLSGVYLMMAECLNENGDLDGALLHINALRDRWGLLELAGAEYDTQEEVRARLQFFEYPMELSVEGVYARNIDLRRWGIAKERYQTLSETDYYLTDYTYVDTDPTTTAIRRNSFLLPGVTSNDADVQLVPEYSGAAAFYTDGYWPLPASETINNPQVSN